VSEYMGILLLVAVIVGALVYADVDDRLARATSDMVASISGGGRDDASGGGTDPGGGGRTHPGGGAATNPGAGGSGPGGGEGPGGSGGARSEGERRTILCLNSTAEAANCLVAARAPNAVSEKIAERARQKVIDAQKRLYNTARPGTPEFQKALGERNAAIRELFDSRRITNNFIAKPLAQVRKLVDPRYKDMTKGWDRLSKAMGRAPAIASAPRPGNTSFGGPAKPTAGAKVLSHLGKLGKGLGIAGTALGLYDNVGKDGAAKGIFETAVGTAGAYGAGAAITAGCAAVGVATAGVGGLACAAVAFGGSYLAGKYGTEFAGWAWDRGADAVNAVNDHVIKPVADVTKKAAGKVVDAGSKLVEGGEKVIGALNPFG
jgi:hypothetical protein